MKISEFPESLRPILEEIDNEGDGMLEIDEIPRFSKCSRRKRGQPKMGKSRCAHFPRNCVPRSQCSTSTATAPYPEQSSRE